MGTPLKKINIEKKTDMAILVGIENIGPSYNITFPNLHPTNFMFYVKFWIFLSSHTFNCSFCSSDSTFRPVQDLV